MFSVSDLNSLVEESLKMSNFNHPNVMKLIGVCIDRNTPYIVMPYMTNGSLLSYLRKNREDLTTSDEDDVVRYTTLLSFSPKYCSGRIFSVISKHNIYK